MIGLTAALASVYKTLERLEKRGLVTSRMGNQAPSAAAEQSALHESLNRVCAPSTQHALCLTACGRTCRRLATVYEKGKHEDRCRNANGDVARGTEECWICWGSLRGRFAGDFRQRPKPLVVLCSGVAKSGLICRVASRCLLLPLWYCIASCSCTRCGTACMRLRPRACSRVLAAAQRSRAQL